MSEEEVVLTQWYAYYCPVHDALSTSWNCYCGKQTMEVVVKVYRQKGGRYAN